MTSKMTEIASKTLGDSTSYAVYTDKYDKTLLNPMPRALARSENGISDDDFDGFDVWHCYESTFLTDQGHAVSGILKFVYPSNTVNMIESKSMKLFLNSFDMCQMGGSIRDSIENYISVVRDSLIECLGDKRVHVNFFRHVDIFNENVKLTNNTLLVQSKMFDLDYRSQKEDINTIYSENNNGINYLTLDMKNLNNLSSSLSFESLRSRCRHTKQKDTGIALVTQSFNNEKINLKYFYKLTPVSIYHQLLKMRETSEFHEFCAEKLFVDIKNVYDSLESGTPDNIVALLYTRRGSLDINPVRFNKDISSENFKNYIESFVNVNNLTMPSIIQ